MVIKVTKPGRLPEEEVFRGKCYHCKTEFECQRKDGKYDGGDQRDGPFLKIECPLCHTQAFAYPLPGGSLIPNSKRQQLTWDVESFYER